VTKLNQGSFRERNLERLSPTSVRARTRLTWYCDSLKLMNAALLQHEQARYQPIHRRGDNHHVRIGRGLHSRGDVGSIAENFRLATATFAGFAQRGDGSDASKLSELERDLARAGLKSTEAVQRAS
jgi:hypothetical protein